MELIMGRWICKREVKDVKKRFELKDDIERGEFIYLGFEPQTVGD
jgi:hypothetical protein